LAIGRFIGELVDDIDSSVNLQKNITIIEELKPKITSTPPTAPIAPPSFTQILLEQLSYFFPFSSPLKPINPSKKTEIKNNTKIGETYKFSNNSVRATTKLLVYSGHDSTMVPLLGAIGLYQGQFIYVY
jgi:hypothetical protein